MRAAPVFVFLCVLNNLGISIGLCVQSRHDHDFEFWLKCSNATLLEALDQGNLSLSGIVISQSKLLTIPRYAFTKYAATLLNLNLPGCDINSVSPDAFKGLSHLRKLSLSNNNITVVHPEWFVGLTWLEKVDLSFNNIKTISPKAFAEMANVHILNINYNKMTYLTIADTLTKMKTLKKIRIEGNPWNINFRGKMTRWFHDMGIDYNDNSHDIDKILDQMLWFCNEEESDVCDSEICTQECLALLLLNQFRSAAQTSASYVRAGSQCNYERSEFTTCVSRKDGKNIIKNGNAVKMLLSGLWAMRSS